MSDLAAASAADRPRIAAVGAGYWGKNIVRNLDALGTLAAICDPDRANVAALAAAHRVPLVGFDDALADPAIAGVTIAAPATAHAALARAALAAGKHVFVEKPLALAVAEAEELVELARRQRRILMVGHLLQYHPAFIRLAQMVREGALGRLQYLYSNRLNLGKVRREEDILWSFAPHDISMILALVGGEPVSVSATGASYLHKEIADVTTTHLAFAGGEQAHVFVSWLHPFKEQKLVVVGDHAMAVFDDGEPWPSKLQLYSHRIEWRNSLPVPQRAEATPVAIEADEPLRQELAHFLDCIASGSRPRTDGEEGVRVLRVLAQATASLRPPRAEAVGDAKTHRGAKIHATACIDEPCDIGEGTRIWHFCHVLARTRIGRDCVLGQNVVAGPDVAIGDGCKIQNNVSVYKGVTLEAGVFCGPAAVFTNVVNPRAEIERKSEFKATLVRRGATIGANATVLCGHTIGAYAFIGAGAVVTKDVPDFALMVGNPARRVGWMSRAGARLGRDLVCPIEGRRYRETAPGQLALIED